MKNTLTIITLLLVSIGIINSAFAEPKYITYNIEVKVDDEVAIKKVPVRAPEGATVSLSPSSPADNNEVVFKISTFENGGNLEFQGALLNKEKGAIVSESEFKVAALRKKTTITEIEKGGKTYQLKLEPRD